MVFHGVFTLPDFVSVLLLRSGGRFCGLPVEHVVETMRPLPTESLGEAPSFVRGLARIRGEAVPVLDLNRLLGGSEDTVAGRYLSLRVGARRVALAVEELLELRVLDRDLLSSLPPLLSAGAAAVQAVGALDSSLLLVLQAAKLIPDGDWLAVEPAPGR